MPRKLNLIGLTLLIAATCSCTQCPALPITHDWTLAEQQQIAKERNALPPDSILLPVLEEWSLIRREIKG